MTFPCPHCKERHDAGTLTCPATGEDIDPVHHMVGRILDEKYEIEALVGVGGMGAVYRARHTQVGSVSAIKVLRAQAVQDRTAVERFMREARAAGEVRHENIVEIHDLGKDPDGTVYMVMQHLEGRSLKDLCREGPLKTRLACDIMVQILSALAAAHRHGIVHRDMKPGNVFLTSVAGRDDFVKLLDFGIAKVKLPDQEHDLTRTGDLVGTPYYMSPEQARGDRDIDHRADIYSSGVMLYQMLSGKLPFEGGNVLSLVYKVINEDAPSVQAHVPDLPPELASVVHRAMQKDPAERYQSASEFGEALEPFASPQVTASAVASLRMTTPMNWSSATGRADDVGRSPYSLRGKRSERNSRVITIVVVAALFFVLGAVGLGLYLRDRHRGRAPDGVNVPAEQAARALAEERHEGPPLVVDPEMQPAPPPETKGQGADDEAILSVEKFVLEKWLESQLAGDLDRYGALLSDDFRAVSMLPGRGKKSETDREGWLKRREKTIAGAARYEIEDVRVDIGADSATVRFRYLWNPEDYCDTGEKKLVLVADGESYKVTLEETLSADECDFDSHATFRTFVATLGASVRTQQWVYIRDHCRFPVKNGEKSVEDINAVKTGGWIDDLRFATTLGEERSKTVGGLEYVYDHTYQEGQGATLSAQVTDVATGEATSRATYVFAFEDGRWMLVERIEGPPLADHQETGTSSL